MNNCQWVDSKVKPCPSGFQHYIELGKPYFGKDIQRGHIAKFCPFCGVNIVDVPLKKIKWEISGEHDRNHFIKGEDGNYAILVYRIDGRKSKKLNKITRKYEKIDIPDQWHVIFSLIQRQKFTRFFNEKEAIDFAEDIFIQAVNNIENISKFLRLNVFK